MIEVMLVPALACLVLIGIHVYFGVQVIQRGIIFIDLCLAQVAALGGLIARLVLGTESSSLTWAGSIIATAVAAGFFAVLEHRRKALPMEAIIGIIYALSAATAMLAIHFTTTDSHDLQRMLSGELLFVQLPSIAWTAAFYVLVALAHGVLTHRPSNTAPSVLGNFAFYAALGLVVTSSVKMAGVLSVFTFLIVPAFCAQVLFNSFRTQLIAGWSIGAVTAIGGIAASVFWDLPTGLTVVCAFAVPFAITLAVVWWQPAVSASG
jgi:zinc/manganese transport system permease protein